MKKLLLNWVLFLLLFSTNSWSDTVAFFYALDKDFEMLKAAGQSLRETIKIGSRSIQSIQIGRHIVLCLKMGSGAVESAISGEALLGRFHCDLVISLGPVGILNDVLEVGQWYQVGEVVAYQKGSENPNGFSLAENARFPMIPFSPSVKGIPNLFSNAPSIRVASGEIFVASSLFRSKLRDVSQADVVDMNLFGLLAAVKDHGTVHVGWRIASDHANDEASNDFKKFVTSYNGAGGKAVAELIEKLPPNPNVPDSYPHLQKLLDKNSKK